MPSSHSSSHWPSHRSRSGIPTAIADPGLTAPRRSARRRRRTGSSARPLLSERDAAPAPYVDAFERPDPTSFQTATSSPTESGTNIAWSQIGIAFGVGLVLALGLMVALRFRPNRTLAH